VSGAVRGGRRLRAALAGTFAALVAGLAFAGPLAADPVDVELVLSVDSSGSIDMDEFGLQRQGYALALTSPEVLKAIARGPRQAIAVTLVEWSGPPNKTVVVPWTRIATEADAKAVAATLLSRPRTIFGGGTSVGDAIDYAVAMFEGNGFEGARKVIDVSGDGPNNRGGLPEPARDRAVAHQITINGLAILEGPGRYLLGYYERSVIGGPGAFAMAAVGFNDFADAVRRKLERELNISAVTAAGRPPGGS
jgi:hypothetical protein